MVTILSQGRSLCLYVAQDEEPDITSTLEHQGGTSKPGMQVKKQKASKEERHSSK